MYRRTSQHIRSSTCPSLTKKTKSVTFDLPSDNDLSDIDYDGIIRDTVNSHQHKSDVTSDAPPAAPNDVTKSPVKPSVTSSVAPSMFPATTDPPRKSTRNKRTPERYGFE